MTVLVDTSIWSLALRRSPGHLAERERRLVERWGKLVRDSRVAIMGPIRRNFSRVSGKKPTSKRSANAWPRSTIFHFRPRITSRLLDGSTAAAAGASPVRRRTCSCARWLTGMASPSSPPTATSNTTPSLCPSACMLVTSASRSAECRRRRPGLSRKTPDPSDLPRTCLRAMHGQARMSGGVGGA